MVIESGKPFRQICRGSSMASKSEWEVEEPLSTVCTAAVIVSGVIVSTLIGFKGLKNRL